VKRICFLILTLCLTGCGFHLRGTQNMPRWLNKIAIIVQNAQPDLKPLLRDQLQAYHIRVCEDPSVASYWLVIESDHVRQQIASISSSTTPRQYQLFYTVCYQLQQANGKIIQESKQITVTRLLTVNSDRILGSNDEEDRLKYEMRRDAVMQILDSIEIQAEFRHAD
jgi:LPS-assembly lipoprotein